MKPFRFPHPSSLTGLWSHRRRSTTAPAPLRNASAVEALEGRRLLTVLPAGFAETQVGTSVFVSPTSMALTPDGRVLVAEQTGELKVIKDNVVLDAPFLTVNTITDNERGLIGVAVDPDFATNHYVYITYTDPDPQPHNRLSRFVANGDVAVPGSETVIYETGPMLTSFHNGGAIHFGPDGMLYTSVGENGGGAQSQQLTSHKGKILRMRPDGSIPPDNPFVNQTTGNFGAIWAMGLRNPFSFAIHPTTGRVLINDVGENTWEEVDEGHPGANYGWADTEGPTNDPRFTSPLYAYQHTSSDRAITGAGFYAPANPTFPAEMRNDYFFGDYTARKLYKLDYDTAQVEPFALGVNGRPVDIDVTDDGSMYYLGRPTEQKPGGVFRITYSASGAPSIAIQPQNKTGSIGRPVTFTVEASGEEPITYQWQRNGTNIPGATDASYTLPTVAAGDNGAQFRVVVSNASGTVTSNAATLTVTNNQPPTVTITAPAAGALFSAGDTIAYSGAATDPEDGPITDASKFTWWVDLHHADHTHPFLQPFSNKTSGTFAAAVDHKEPDIFLRVYLSVKDSTGLETTTFTDVLPRTSTMTFATNVPGLRVRLDDVPLRSPAPVLGVVGVQRALEAPATQTVNGVTYEFVSWSDTLAAGHTISTPAADTTYTATYRAVDGGTGRASDPDLTAALVTELPPAAVEQSAGRTRVRVTNTGDAPFVGAANLKLFLSPDPYLDPEDTAAGTVPKSLKLKPGKSKVISVPFTYPQVVNGAYYLLVYADPGAAVPERDRSNNVAAAGAPVTVAPAFVDLSGQITSLSVLPAPARRGTVTMLVRNDGNSAATGLLTVRFGATGTSTAPAQQLGNSSKQVKIKAGGAKRVRLRFALPTLAADTYHVTGSIDPQNTIPESDDTNNTATSDNTFTVG